MVKKAMFAAVIVCALLLFSGSAVGGHTPNEKLEFEYAVQGEEIVITGYIGGDPHPVKLVIPSMIEKKPVTIIGEGALRQWIDLEEVILPQTLRRIERDAFGRCFSLKNITLPASIQFVDVGAFWRCHSLEWIHVERSGEVDEKYFSYNGVLYTNIDGRLTMSIYPEGRQDEIHVFMDAGETVSFEGSYHPQTQFFVFPSSVKKIESSIIFEDKVFFVVTEGSAAEAYAKQRGIRYMYYFQHE